MITIKEVSTKKDVKLFTHFPLKLYKNNAYYVPAFIADEITLFSKTKNANLQESEIVGFLAFENKKVVGRIAGILQKTDNKITQKNRVRISRIDFVDNYEVSAKLFESIENWAREKNMNEVHGPLGFNDLEREGLLVYGFEELSTFEENYNYKYYSNHFEKLGYSKSVKWNEYQISIPTTLNPKVERLASLVSKKHKLKTVEGNVKKIITQYKDKIFNLVEECYSPLYGVVPINEKLKNQLIKQFKLLVTMDYLTLVVNEDDRLVGFSLVFPSLAKSMQKTKGKILSPYIFSLLKSIKHNDTIDLGLIAVSPDYRKKGVAAIVMARNIKNFIKNNIKFAETNLQLEDNSNIHALFSGFEMRHHKDRICYIKKV